MNAVPFSPIEVSLKSGEKLHFAAVEEVDAFLKVEQQELGTIVDHRPADMAAWQELTACRNELQGMKQSINALRGLIERARADIEAKSKQADSFRGQFDQWSANFSARLNQLYNSLGFFTSSSAHGRFLHDVVNKHGLSVAFYALLHLLRRDFVIGSVHARTGVWVAQLYEANMSQDRSEAETAALKNAVSKWNEFLQQMTQERVRLNSEANGASERQTNAIGALQKQTAEQASVFAATVDEMKQKANDQRVSFYSQFEALRKSYEQFVKLEAPVRYWRIKKDTHQREVSRFTILLAAGMVISFGGIAIFASNALSGSSAEPAWWKPGGSAIPWRELCEFFILTTVAIWVNRLLVRLLLSSIHLMRDAAEREVMAMTYLALIRGGKQGASAVDEKDRGLVLGALFRPAASGIVDDVSPPHLSDAIGKIAGR